MEPTQKFIELPVARQNRENDSGFTSYFLERISELPLESYDQSIEAETGQKAFNLNFESCVSFPSKLYKCLVDAEQKRFSSVISWQQDGMSFKVHNQERFVKDILPLYFGAIKFKSWQRQLNLYGFTRVQKGLTRGSYTHDHFVRGQRSLSLEISRQKWTANGNSASSATKPVYATKGSVCVFSAWKH